MNQEKELIMHMVPVEVQEKYFEDMTKVKAREDLPDLYEAFPKLKVGDTNE